MKMSTQEISDEARSQWVDPSTTFITAAEVLRWINMAEADFVRYTKCIRYKWQFSTVANQQEYHFPIDARLYEILWMTMEGKPIYPTTVDELGAYSRTWRQAAGGPTGEPEFYYIHGIHDEQLGFFKCPDEVYTAVAYYVEDPPAMTAINNNTYPKIRETWHDALVSYVEWRGHKKNRSHELANQARKDYQIIREEAHNAFTSLQPERMHVLGGPEDKIVRRNPHWPRWPSNYGVDS